MLGGRSQEIGQNEGQEREERWAQIGEHGGKIIHARPPRHTPRRGALVRQVEQRLGLPIPRRQIDGIDSIPFPQERSPQPERPRRRTSRRAAGGPDRGRRRRGRSGR